MIRYPRLPSRAPLFDEEMISTPEVFEAASMRRNARAKKWTLAAEQPYDGNEGLLVKTVLLRHPDYRPDRYLPMITCANDVTILCSHLQDADQEHVVVLPVSSKSEVRAIFEVSIGTSVESRFDPSEVIKVPLLTGCSGFVLVHNHPGGMRKPSEQDRLLTDKVARLAKCVRLQLLDHVIIARYGSFSFLEEGLMPKDEG